MPGERNVLATAMRVKNPVTATFQVDNRASTVALTYCARNIKNRFEL